MLISARFYLNRLILAGSSWATVEMSPVTRGGDNAAWSSATPSGKMTLNSLTDEEVDWFCEQRRSRPSNGYGVEFDVWFGKPEDTGPYGAAKIIRDLRLSSVARDAKMGPDKEIVYADSGAVKLIANGGQYTEVEMTITNPRAYMPLRSDFCGGGDGVWWMALL